MRHHTAQPPNRRILPHTLRAVCVRRFALACALLFALLLPSHASAETDPAPSVSPTRSERPATDDPSTNGPEAPAYVAVEMGVGAPAGHLGLRLNMPVIDDALWLQAGFGSGYTGWIASVGLAVPLMIADVPAWTFERGRVPEWMGGPVAIALYGGYGLAFRDDDHRAPWAAQSTVLDAGESHWLDLGLLVTIGLFEHSIITTGFGLGLLLNEEDVHNEGYSEAPFPPSWWIEAGVTPSLFAGYGVRF